MGYFKVYTSVYLEHSQQFLSPSIYKNWRWEWATSNYM